MASNCTAQVWQDALLAVSRQLPLQRDIPSLLRTLKQCCGPFIAFQRINLVIAESLSGKSSLYSLDEQADRWALSEIALMPEPEQRHFWAQTEVEYFDRDRLLREFPAVARLEQFRGASACLLLPLIAQGEQAGLVEFVKTDGLSFGEEALAFCRVLAGIITVSLAAILKIEAVQRETEIIRRERNHFSILVDVTNTAIGTLEMGDMVDKVAEEIRRFFGIRSFALLLRNPDSEGFAFYPASEQEEGSFSPPATATKHHPVEGSLLQRTLTENAPCLMRRVDLPRNADKDPAVSFILGGGNQAVCLFPLHFGQRCLGAMLLAHSHPDIFTSETVSLLEEIASRVAIAVQNALDYAAVTVQKESLAQENFYLSEQIQKGLEFGQIIGKSEAFRRVLQQVDMVASSDSTVLLLGETGTGKEVFAQAIHSRSQRRTKRMVKMNCAAVPTGLLESELFGHEKGAFTGAGSQRKGRFELAQGSTLMLDEVGDIPLELQPKLLRVLQSREIERLGGNKIIPLDVRLVAATNRNLQDMVLDGTFRADLFYRLNVFPIAIPPLRERREDIPLLAQYFTQKMARQMKKNITRIPDEAMRWLCEQQWPGNVRELTNVIERAVILSSGSSLNICPFEGLPPVISQVPEHLAVEVHHGGEFTPPKSSLTHPQPGETASERDRIITALIECNGVMAGPRGVAAKLGLKRTTLLSRMQRMGISIREVLEGRSQV